MTKVARYTQNEMQMSRPVQVVLAEDFDALLANLDAALKQVEGLRELMAEAVPALQHISDTAQDLESFTLAERFRAALQAKP